MPPVLKPHRCGGCSTRWGGSKTCHCAACHLTFTAITAFDAHRTAAGECRSRAEICQRGYTEVRPGVLGSSDPRPESVTGHSR